MILYLLEFKLLKIRIQVYLYFNFIRWFSKQIRVNLNMDRIFLKLSSGLMLMAFEGVLFSCNNILKSQMTVSIFHKNNPNIQDSLIVSCIFRYLFNHRGCGTCPISFLKTV